MEIKLTIHTNSDFHLGSGFGLAKSIDDRLLKDENGQPYLPGSTIKALIRDGVERLLALDPLQEVAVCGGEYRYQAMLNSTLPASQTATTSSITSSELSKKIGLGQNGRTVSRLCGVLPLLDEEGQPRPLDWRCPLCRVFGTAFTPGSFSFGSAFQPAETAQFQAHLRQKLEKKPDYLITSLLQPLTSVTTYNRIDRRTGRAEDEKLFSFELGARETRFETTIKELNYPEDQLARLQNWLIVAAGCAYVEELGKRRRRGLGACHFELGSVPTQLLTALELPSETVLLDHLEKLLTPASSTRLAFQERTIVRRDYATRYIVVAQNEETLLISQKSEAGNTVATLNYLNGTSLRGALATEYLRRHGVRHWTDLQGQAQITFVGLFGGSEPVRFSNLMPAQQDSRRSGTLYPAIFAPRSVFTCKLHSGPMINTSGQPSDDEPHGVSDFLHNPELLRNTCPFCSSSLENYDGLLALTKKGTWEEVQELEPKSEVVMHNTIHDRTGRTFENSLFSYKTLQRGQYFAGVIETLNDSATSQLAELLAGLGIEPTGGELRVRLGRATSRGQGQVLLKFIPSDFAPSDYYPALLVGTPLEKRFKLEVLEATDDVLCLYLASDCILQDANLSYCSYVSAAMLAERLGVERDALSDVSQPRYVATRLIEGWNVSHGLPRETEVAIAAGSVMRYRLKNNEPELRARVQAGLKRLERLGLGQRREEGFGRVVFNHPIHTRLDQLNLLDA